MYYIQDAHSFWDWIYFVCLIVIGSFFLINLCLVVIAAQFSETKQRETERMMAERFRGLCSSGGLVDNVPGTCWEEAIKYLERLLRRGYRRIVQILQSSRCRNTETPNRIRKHRHQDPPSPVSNDVIHKNEEEVVEHGRMILQRWPIIQQVVNNCVNSLQKRVFDVVNSKAFRRFVFSVIVLNSLSMAIEYHGQPQALTNALEYSNFVFIGIFVLEMILKVFSDGYLNYIKNAYNLFDSVIVLMSIIELQESQSSGLSVLRTFRLLRVLKLIRFMPTLRQQLVSGDLELMICSTTELACQSIIYLCTRLKFRRT